jgi:hypothetical protein
MSFAKKLPSSFFTTPMIIFREKKVANFLKFAQIAQWAKFCPIWSP